MTGLREAMESSRRIGVYVHGRSNLYRALPVMDVLRRRGEEVTLLAAGPMAEHLTESVEEAVSEGWVDPSTSSTDAAGPDPAGPGWTEMAAGAHPGAPGPGRDVPDPGPGGESQRTTRPDQLTVVHLPVPDGWIPPSGPGYEALALSTRLAALAWIERAQPHVFWVDGSPAMSLATHMTGTPVVSTVPPGIRRDEPHILRCRSAETLIGPWPAGRFPHTVEALGAQVHEVGGISRFERRAREGSPRRRPRVVHLNSAGPRGDYRFWRAVRASTERMGSAEWVEIGGPDGKWRDDPWPELSTADVVVTCAGQSSVADAACCDVPMVVVPRRHEFGEQQATAEVLDALPGVTVVRYGEGPSAVARAVTAIVESSESSAIGNPGTGIRHAWEVDGAAGRAADVIMAAARA